MSIISKAILCLQALLVFGMIVLDPHEAHRPPVLRAEADMPRMTAVSNG